jgi:hypothetical protein
LRDFEQTDIPLIVNESSTLYVRFRLLKDIIEHKRTHVGEEPDLVSELHEELCLAVNQVLQNFEINANPVSTHSVMERAKKAVLSTQVVDVANKDVFFASLEQSIQQSGVSHSVENVTVTWRVPIPPS